MVGIIIAFATGAFSGDQTTVPSVLNKDQETAIQLIKDAGFEVGNIDQNYSDDVDEGKVMEQTPDANSQKPKGTKIDIVISKGPKPAEQVEVPNLVGKSKDEAEAALAEVGLKGNPTEEENDADPGKVFDQDTAAGKKVDAGSTISYKVSKGPGEIAVPGVTGKSKNDAINTLSNAGFSVDVAEDSSDSVDEGYVISQSVTGTAKKGTTITITVSTGSNKTSVPDVTGLSASSAANKIAAAGFRYNLVDTKGNPISEDTAGTVTNYSPNGKQSQGATIRVVVQVANSDASSDDTSGN